MEDPRLNLEGLHAGADLAMVYWCTYIHQCFFKPFSFINIRNTDFFHPLRPRAPFTQKGVAIPFVSLSFLSGGFPKKSKKSTGTIMFTFLSSPVLVFYTISFGVSPTWGNQDKFY